MMPVLIGAILALAVLVLVLLARRETLRERAAVAPREQFPPITDAEFLALCPPGTNPEVALKVRRIVADYFGVEYERVHPSMSFLDDLGA
jgi:hypothetical protein